MRPSVGPLYVRSDRYAVPSVACKPTERPNLPIGCSIVSGTRNPRQTLTQTAFCKLSTRMRHSRSPAAVISLPSARFGSQTEKFRVDCMIPWNSVTRAVRHDQLRHIRACLYRPLVSVLLEVDAKCVSQARLERRPVLCSKCLDRYSHIISSSSWSAFGTYGRTCLLFSPMSGAPRSRACWQARPSILQYPAGQGKAIL